MSYGLGLYFKQVNNKEEAYEFARKVSDNIRKNAEERIKNAITYCPSIRLLTYLEPKKNNPELDYANEYWLYNTFTNFFVFWEKYNLLGMMETRIPKETETMFDVNVYFQNSTDQDYDFKTWGDKIELFNHAINQMSIASFETICKRIEKVWGTDEDDEQEKQEIRDMVNEDIEYYRRSSVYDMIFDALDLDTYMEDENESNSFIRFSMGSISGSDNFFSLKTIMKIAIKEEEEYIMSNFGEK